MAVPYFLFEMTSSLFTPQIASQPWASLNKRTRQVAFIGVSGRDVVQIATWGIFSLNDTELCYL